MSNALILGQGVGALCCAKLLSQKGWKVCLDSGDATACSPTVVLNFVTIQLINEIFNRPEEIFKDAHQLTRRHVHWDSGELFATSESPCLVMRGDVLTERLLIALKSQDADKVIYKPASFGEDALREEAFTHYDWIVCARKERMEVAEGFSLPETRRFGKRHAILAEVNLSSHAETAACWIESTPVGWLFLAPVTQERALLQIVLPLSPPKPEQVMQLALCQSRIIRNLVSGVLGVTGMFDSSPALLSPLNGSRWIATGSYACSYDPLCGDGTGYAIREAILTAAVLDAIEKGAARDQCLEHYRSRLTHAFYAHLRACYSFYSTSALDHTWAEEMKATSEGMLIVGRELDTPGGFQYGLRNFDLVPIEQFTHA